MKNPFKGDLLNEVDDLSTPSSGIDEKFVSDSKLINDCELNNKIAAWVNFLFVITLFSIVGFVIFSFMISVTKMP